MPRATVTTQVDRCWFSSWQKECSYPRKKTVRQTDMWLLSYKPRKSVTTAGRSYNFSPLFSNRQAGATAPARNQCHMASQDRACSNAHDRFNLHIADYVAQFSQRSFHQSAQRLKRSGGRPCVAHSRRISAPAQKQAGPLDAPLSISTRARYQPRSAGHSDQRYLDSGPFRTQSCSLSGHQCVKIG